MGYETLIDVATAKENLTNSNWLFVDCRFNLADPNGGREDYLNGHIAGAVYAHLDHDLSGPPVTDNGRHPLPTVESLRALFSRWGITPDTQVVVYDDFVLRNGISARLWWMLHYMGHNATAVLDGGWQAWVDADAPIGSGIVSQRKPTLFTGEPRPDWLVQIDEVPEAKLLIDSRDGGRFSGEFENIDPIAGHIPGAVNYFFKENLGEDGRFLTKIELKEKLTPIIGEHKPEEAVFYCGSGVTACHNLLAMKHAGMGAGRLYVGSWSEWSRRLAEQG